MITHFRHFHDGFKLATIYW